MGSSGIFSNIVALFALAISLVSAGWSAFAYVKSSEVRPFPVEEIAVFSEDGVPQILVEVTIANLAYGEYHDVARAQELIIDTGEHRLRFVARKLANLNLLRPNADNSYPMPEYPCYRGGVGLAVCPLSEIPVVSLPAGQVATITPVFELAESNCGIDDCYGLSIATLGEMMTGSLDLTYSVSTMRDGVRSVSCKLTVSPEDAQYFTGETGWFNPRCEGVEG